MGRMDSVEGPWGPPRYAGIVRTHDWSPCLDPKCANDWLLSGRCDYPCGYASPHHVLESVQNLPRTALPLRVRRCRRRTCVDTDTPGGQPGVSSGRTQHGPTARGLGGQNTLDSIPPGKNGYPLGLNFLRLATSKLSVSHGASPEPRHSSAASHNSSMVSAVSFSITH